MSQPRQLIVCGFPGVGKSECFRRYGDKFKMSDSDSSKFPKDKFPGNYIEHILSTYKDNDYTFVSTHKDVVAELIKADVEFSVVYPLPWCKDAYLARYKERGSPEAFIKLLDEKWLDFLTDIERSQFVKGKAERHYLAMDEDEFLADQLEHIWRISNGEQ